MPFTSTNMAGETGEPGRNVAVVIIASTLSIVFFLPLASVATRSAAGKSEGLGLAWRGNALLGELGERPPQERRRTTPELNASGGSPPDVDRDTGH